MLLRVQRETTYLGVGFAHDIDGSGLELMGLLLARGAGLPQAGDLDSCSSG